MDRPVPDGRFGWTLTDEVLQVLLEALLVLQEAHGYVVVCLALVQLREEDPARRTPRVNRRARTLLCSPEGGGGGARFELTCCGRI